MEKTMLVKDDKYEGKYVAFVSVTDHKIVAEGESPEDVFNEAKKSGCPQPMIVFVPDKGMTCCY